MLGDCYLYRHQMYSCTGIHEIAHFKQRNVKLWMGYFDSDFDND